MMNKTIKTGDLRRFFDLKRDLVDEENRTVQVSFSSETPVERWFGEEVLSHIPGSVRLDRLNAGAPLLWNHDIGDQIGVIENATIEDDRGTAMIRFSKSARGQEIFSDVLDGIRGNVSVGYRIHEMEQDEDAEDPERFLATDWEPHEISLVSVPADVSVGVSREIVGNHSTRVLIEEPIMEKIIDIEAVQNEAKDQALAQERERIQSINQMASDASYLREIASRALNEGVSLSDFQAQALEATKAELARKPVHEVAAPVANLDLDAKEQNRYSFIRAIKAASTGDWTKAGFEREVSDEIAKNQGESSGFYIPNNVSWGRDLTVGSATAGGNLVQTDVVGDSFIDVLRAKAVVIKAGAQVLENVVGDVAIPRLSAGTTVYWTSEATAATEGAPTFDQVSLSPKHASAFVDISRTLLHQASVSVENIIRDDITQSIANAVDQVSLNGAGSGEPRGILQTTGIGQVIMADTSSPQVPTFAEVVGMETQVTKDNADLGSLAYVVSPTAAGALKGVVVDSGSGRFVLQDGQVNGYPCHVTTNMPSDDILIFGNFNDLVIAQFGGIEVLTERFASTGLLRLALHLSVDVAVRHAQSFAEAT